MYVFLRELFRVRIDSILRRLGLRGTAPIREDIHTRPSVIIYPGEAGRKGILVSSDRYQRSVKGRSVKSSVMIVANGFGAGTRSARV